ncbi:MAG: tRNA (adenosine(37)-N6)-threonylcarbamoyltransferase complex dimerization subunit type 1 TsaB [Bacteroidota bacterium]|nr:tRNA (adenosine(37)-N6)-threonylcarbamoyltransferase complex dimerization subunit type 1 TsaB [Bacteroidota bacterium]
MGILLIETSSKKIEFGYAIQDKVIFKEQVDSNHNADTLVYFIKKSFAKNKIDFSEIEFVSLSNGPGSFTGLRIGSAIAKGICFASGNKLIEIPTLDIIANKYKSDKRVISLIFSNTRALEFYYCEYEFDSGKLKRISDYKIDLIENIININAEFVINENIKENIPEQFMNKLIDVSADTYIYSMLELTKNYITESKFSDYKLSEPFYMKEFIPVK